MKVSGAHKFLIEKRNASLINEAFMTILDYNDFDSKFVMSYKGNNLPVVVNLDYNGEKHPLIEVSPTDDIFSIAIMERFLPNYIIVLNKLVRIAIIDEMITDLS